MFRPLSTGVMMCLVIMFFLVLPDAPMAADFSGEWQGSYASGWDSELSGTLRGVFTQNGNQLTGTVDIVDSGCQPEYGINIYQGSCSGNYAQFKVDMNCYDPETGYSGTVTSQFQGSKASGPFSGN